MGLKNNDELSRKERVEDALDYMYKCVRHLPSKLQTICNKILKNEDFLKGYGASVGEYGHHAYPGGLVVHTAEVLELALRMAENVCTKKADTHIITTAVIFHDWSKTCDYDKEGKKMPFAKLINHVSGSYGVFICMATDVNLDEYLYINIGHCILAHHGRKEWGSPVEPQTIEAEIIHYADKLSAGYGNGRG